MKSPMKYYDEQRKQNNRDKFYYGLRNIYIYVEDRGKKLYYNHLLKKIGIKEFECFDIIGSKKGLINHYFINKNEYQNTSKIKYIFLLDKDFDDKCIQHNLRLEGHTFEELKAHENFVIWKKYCIENYLVSLDLVMETTEILCCEEINKTEYKKRYLDLYSKVRV